MQPSLQTLNPAQTGSSTLTFDLVRPAQKVADKKFWFLSVAMNSTMVADTWSTFDALKRCSVCYEADPMAAPFVARGPGATLAAGEALDVSVMVVAAKMKGSDRPFFRRVWWVIPVALTTGHLLALQHNMRINR
jgi:hypothetical protein